MTGDAGRPVIIESSASALVTTIDQAIAWQLPIPVDEERRLATKLDEMRAHETSTLGRALIARDAGMLWELAGESDRAHAALLASVHEDPLLLDAWQHLVLAAGDTGSGSQAASVGSAWFPWETFFLHATSSKRTDELDERLSESRLAYLLEPSPQHAMFLSRALAEAGRGDEARAIEAIPPGGSAPDRRYEAEMLALVDLHDAKLDRAAHRLDEAESIGIADLVVVENVLGRIDAAATEWTREMLAQSDDKVISTIVSEPAPIVLCMRARRDLAIRCLDRVSRLAQTNHVWWGAGGEDLLRGAQRYAKGDITGAVAIWRPLVAGPNWDISMIIPTDAFERAGEPDLAARIDARKMSFRFIAGVSEAAPREAKRALAAGDKARAKELAQKVIDAWEVADTVVPAVAEMRALLRSIDH